jgi:hypothetical protein
VLGGALNQGQGVGLWANVLSHALGEHRGRHHGAVGFFVAGDLGAKKVLFMLSKILRIESVFYQVKLLLSHFNELLFIFDKQNRGNYTFFSVIGSRARFKD